MNLCSVLGNNDGNRPTSGSKVGINFCVVGDALFKLKYNIIRLLLLEREFKGCSASRLPTRQPHD